MSDKKVYVSPPQDPLIKRLIKKGRIFNGYIVAVFKAPYKTLSASEKILKTFLWFALIAMIVAIVLGVIYLVFAVLAALFIGYISVMALSGDGSETMEIKNNYGRTVGSVTRRRM